MKKFILFFLLFSKVVFAQESNDKIIYLDSLQSEVTIENKYYTKIIKDYYLEKSEYKFLILYKNGKLKEEKTLSGKDDGFIIGDEIKYYENGTKSSSVHYENKKQHGKSYYWYEDGKPKEEGEFNSENFSTGKHYKIINYWNKKGEKTVSDGNGHAFFENDYHQANGNYKNGYKDGKWIGKFLKENFSYEELFLDGELISGTSTENDGTKHEYTILEIKPEPKKGINDFFEFIGTKFNYSREARKLNIKGKILLAFVVDTEGKIIEPKIIKGLGYGLDEEAIRVITSYENWKLALQKGKRVRCSYKIPLSLTGVQ